MNKGLQKRILTVVLVFALMISGNVYGMTGTIAQAAGKKTTVVWVHPVLSTLTLKTGETYSLKVKVSPASQKKKIRFVSSNKKIAKVSSQGKIKALKKGKVKIKAVDKAKKTKAVLNVTIVKKLKKVKKVVLSASNLTMQLGSQQKLTAKLSPKKATVKKVTYVSSKTKIAKVDKNGMITAVKSGVATITVYAKDGCGAKASCKVTVQERVSPTKEVKPTEQANAVPTTQSTEHPTTVPTGVTSEPTGTAPTVQPTEHPSVEPTNPVTTPPVVTSSVAPTTEVSATPTGANALFEEVETTTADIVLASQSMAPSIYVDADAADIKGLSLIAKSVVDDVALVSGQNGNVIQDIAEASDVTIIAGVIGDNAVLDAMIKSGAIDVSDITGKWETYKLATVQDREHPEKKAVIVAGSDKRGTIYGLYHISELMGVSPWAYWGDVATTHQDVITLANAELNTTSKEPSVKYRGIFLNDEAPSLTGWAKQTFGGYNEKFYEKVYELILRLKGNYLWPAMWSNCFSKDGTDEAGIANAELADEYGIVMGTSHHEPLCRAGNEWSDSYQQYVPADKIVPGEGSGYYWNYDLFPTALTNFWSDGIKRNKAYENIYTIGMRGEADSALEMTTDTFKKIVTTQKNILKENNLENDPNVLVLYKEIEEMWYDGDGSGDNIADWSGLDDTTIMLCDDNYGNLRTLPTEANRDRAAGWGMYYHFDYHGSPRSYEWIDTVSLQKTWEQMSMAYDYGINNIWIVNVGDLKPMEMSTSYFLDMAYDFDKWGTDNTESADEYTKDWVRQQFGDELDETGIKDITSILNEYLSINSSKKPEIVLSNTYSVTNYNEAAWMLSRCEKLIAKAEQYLDAMSEEQKAAFFELVYYPAVASANVNRMQIYSALNEYYYEQHSAAANLYGTRINEAVSLDQELTDTYNKNMYGISDKWRFMMSAPHVGFTHWNSADWTYPEAKWVTTKDKAVPMVSIEGDSTAYKTGECTLEDFTSTNKEKQNIMISNGGGKSFDYTITSDVDWIRCSKENGTVYLQDTVSVGVDWDKITENSTGTLTIAGAGAEVKVHVNAACTDTTSLTEKTYLEEHGYISIDMANYIANQDGADGGRYQILNHYGKSLTAAKVFPTTTTYKDTASAPYLEYKIYVKQDGKYNIISYAAPSNNVDWNSISMKYGIAIDGGEVTTVDTIDGENFCAGDHKGTNNSWSDNVMNNIRISKSTHTLTAGTHTVRIYAKDAALVLEKLVICSGNLKESFFGPKESYYVGKAVSTEDTKPVYNTTQYNLPGNVPAAGYEGTKDCKADSVTAKAGDEFAYPVILTTEGSYRYKIHASSSDHAQIELKLDGESIGTAEVSGDGLITVGEQTQSAGAGTLLLIVKSGTVSLSSIRTAIQTELSGTAAYISTSSGEAEKAVDLDEDTSWTPSAADVEDGTTSLTVDWMEKYSVDHFQIQGAGNDISSYKVQVYDGADYQTVYTGESTDLEADAPIYIQGKKKIQGSKIRFVFTGGTPSVNELVLSPYINWTADDDVMLSATDKNGATCDVPSAIMDGDRISNALASSSMGSGSAIIMNFSKARTINAVNVVTLQEAEKVQAGTGVIPNESMTTGLGQTTYAAYYYAGGKWTLGGSITESDATKRKVLNPIVFAHDVTAEAVKIVVSTSYWIRVVEMEPVWNSKTAVSTMLAEKTDGLDATVNELAWQEEEVGRIQVSGDYAVDEVKIEYASAGEDTYTTLTDYDVWEEVDGFSVIPTSAIKADRIRITVSGTKTMSAIRTWKYVPESAQPKETVIHEETFEKSTGSMGSWAGSSIDRVTEQANSGKRSMIILNRGGNYSSAIINLATFLGTTDKETEYTLSYYIKSGGGDLTIRNTICSSTGGILDTDNDRTTVIHSAEWTKVTYHFTMKTDAYQYFKVETVGDAAGSDGKYTNLYMDDLKIAIEKPDCSCRFTGTPQFTTTDEELQIPKEKDELAVSLCAEAETTKAACAVAGHAGETVSAHYSLLAYDCASASLQKDKLTVGLGEATSGSVLLRASLTINGITRSVIKKFTITKSDQYSEGYKNFALSTNGATITASAGENNSTTLTNLLDGDLTTNRWRTDVLPAYIEIQFASLVDVGQINIYGQDASHPIRACEISYLEDGEWKTFSNGTLTDNTELVSQFKWTESVKTPAIRIDLPKTAVSSNDNWARLAEIEAWGTEHAAGTTCQCQLGTPQYTGDTTIAVSADSSDSSLALQAASRYSTTGCSESGHTEAAPEYRYEIVEDEDQITTLEGSTLHVKNTVISSSVVVKITATLNGLTKTSNQTILVQSSDYENAALSAKGATIAASTAQTDAAALLDGNNSYSNGKRWRTSTYPSTIDISFEQERTLQEIDIFTQQDSTTVTPTKGMTNKTTMAVSSLKLYYWDTSADDWAVIDGSTLTVNDKVWIQCRLSQSISTTKIRVELPEKVADGWARLVEIEAWTDKAESQPIDTSTVDLSQYASLGGTGTGVYNSETGDLTYTYASTKERLYMPLPTALIAKLANCDTSTNKVKITVDATIDSDNISFDSCLMGTGGSNWNSTELAAWTWSTSTASPIEKTVAFSSNAKEENFGYVMLRMKTAATPTIVIHQIKVEIVSA